MYAQDSAVSEPPAARASHSGCSVGMWHNQNARCSVAAVNKACYMATEMGGYKRAIPAAARRVAVNFAPAGLAEPCTVGLTEPRKLIMLTHHVVF